MPLYHDSLDSEVLEKTDDIGGSIVHILGGGGVGMGRNPDDDWTETSLPVLAVSEEPSCHNG